MLPKPRPAYPLQVNATLRRLMIHLELSIFEFEEEYP